MGLLNSLKPSKEVKAFEIFAYEEDMDLFLKALSFLQGKYKGVGRFTQESLFEHLILPLREDPDLAEYLEVHSKKKTRRTRKKSSEVKKVEAIS